LKGVHGEVEAEGDVVAEFGAGGVGAEFDGFELGGPLFEDLKAGERNLEVWDSEERSLRYGRDDNSFLGAGEVTSSE
jgi:hypothetical protein